eukprot:PITA_32487
MFIKITISTGIRGSVDQREKVRDLLKAIDDQFITSDKALASTLIMEFSSLRLTSVNCVREHIMQMRDTMAQLKKLEVEISNSFLVHYILNTLPHQYGPFKISYNTHKNKWSINELMTMCVQEEGGLVMERGESAMLAMRGKGKSQANKKGKGKVPPQADIKKDSKRFFCKKKGHMKKECAKFQKWLVDKGWKLSLRHMRVWGCPSEVRIYNPQEKKLDPRTISGYFIGYVERSKGYKFYCPSHNTKIVESRNAKFLENDLNIVSEKDHSESQPSTSSDRLVIVHSTPQVKNGVEQPIVEVPQAADDIPVDQVVQELPRTFEQRVEPHTSQEDDGTTLRRSTRPKR